MKIAKGKGLIVLHAFGDAPKVTLQEDMHVARGDVYYVLDQEKYTINKTDEQKDREIEKISEMLSDAYDKIELFEYDEVERSECCHCGEDKVIYKEDADDPFAAEVFPEKVELWDALRGDWCKRCYENRARDV